ncbi:hypothetical protein PHAVU_011G080700 [Phaseolus vulgaris]|uniref:Uncharacterized protein n=1 Tax=Phaseolus vulgaris TaxID=3885 RepID=V7AG80_PHAVU|nr:hypothetical protein PHAVU_011G080700g [Phaseolus vulgaris]ESW04265.1 hypothetical protein PHAVU_011G080700g [Phaseolus vulgaris]
MTKKSYTTKGVKSISLSNLLFFFFIFQPLICLPTFSKGENFHVSVLVFHPHTCFLYNIVNMFLMYKSEFDFYI